MIHPSVPTVTTAEAPVGLPITPGVPGVPGAPELPGHWLSDRLTPVDPRRWFVLHTRSRQEKAVVTQLESLGALCFLPLVDHLRKHGQRQRKAHVSLPLFPGYVFLCGSAEQAYAVDRSKRLVSLITVHDQPRLDWELKNLYLALAHHTPLDPYPYLRQGIRAVVKSGPMRGLEGVIDGRIRVDRLILQVDLLGRAVCMEIDGNLLEPLE